MIRDFLAVAGFFWLLNLLFYFVDWIGDNLSWWLGPVTLAAIIISLIVTMFKIARGEK